MKNRSEARSRILLSSLAALVFCFAGVRSASAYDAMLAWKPVKSATGYRIYVADRANLAGARKIEVPTPSVAKDGVVRFVLRDVPLQPTTYFAVAAYDAKGHESKPSNIKPLSEGTVLAVQEAARTDAETAAGRASK